VSAVRKILAGGYYFGKLLFTGIYALAYLRWRIWRAKHTFKAELLRMGIPKTSAKNLASQYNAQNKQIFGSLMNFASFGKKNAKQR
jgi:hypothetical protein